MKVRGKSRKVTNATPTVAVNSCSAAFTVKKIPGIMIIVK